MPAVELCCFCKKKVDDDKDEYIVVAEANKAGAPRVIAHVECAQNRKQ